MSADCGVDRPEAMTGQVSDGTRGRPGGGHPERRPDVVLTLAVVLVALNLRPMITSVGPLLDQVQRSLGTSATWAGLLTTVPVLCFAVAGLATPLLARRAGTTAAIGIALGLLACGLLVRVLGGAATMIGGTLIAASGVAVVAVLLPVVVKASFPLRVGLMTGIYTASLQVGAMLGFALAAPMESALGGWRGGLAGWAALAGLGLVWWLLVARTASSRENPTESIEPRDRSLLRSRLAWVITVFFGLQAMVAFVAIGWISSVLMDAGVSRSDAGLFSGLMALVAVPISLTVPAFAARRGAQGGWIVGLSACGLAGVLGLLLTPSSVPLLWTMLLGLGMSVFSLALTVIALRARTGRDTADLSGMAQGFGYLLAGMGPFLFGWLHDATGGWNGPLLMLVGVLVLQIGTGALAGRPRYV